ncbi:4Fe-4S dicluster domain-containing protein [Thermodesulfovibrio yellowstonii]|uniref:4Fe-4S ferredoxin n=1 Tax=Thermodesulfovibrio yellowstonii TaxID=28262 RepID=A0A9W6GGU5_9BACT|nr:4Fe-4S dicluster domain-containing protein [Thermodesulfovibrio islandicus]GLI53707.1 4Fe-4S ferredoxin [Thermodesulfovibrio islandicus]
MPKYVMVIDVEKCIGCMACVIACKKENNVPEEHFRTRVVEEVRGEFPNLRMELRSELCNHCENAPCIDACPTRASHRAKDGTVQIDRKKCIGCKACILACPYDARYSHPKGFADKCSFCDHRLKEGKKPACVETCLGKSRIFGDLEDPNSEVAELLRKYDASVRLEFAGTRPRVFYIKKKFAGGL